MNQYRRTALFFSFSAPACSLSERHSHLALPLASKDLLLPDMAQLESVNSQDVAPARQLPDVPSCRPWKSSAHLPSNLLTRTDVSIHLC